jgi:hypothetical protein
VTAQRDIVASLFTRGRISLAAVRGAWALRDAAAVLAAGPDASRVTASATFAPTAATARQLIEAAKIALGDDDEARKAEWRDLVEPHVLRGETVLAMGGRGRDWIKRDRALRRALERIGAALKPMLPRSPLDNQT